MAYDDKKMACGRGSVVREKENCDFITACQLKAFYKFIIRHFI